MIISFQSTRPHKPRQQKHTTNIFKPLSQRHYYTTSLKIYHYIITIYLPNPLLFTKTGANPPVNSCALPIRPSPSLLPHPFSPPRCFFQISRTLLIPHYTFFIPSQNFFFRSDKHCPINAFNHLNPGKPAFSNNSISCSAISGVSKCTNTSSPIPSFPASNHTTPSEVFPRPHSMQYSQPL